VDPFRITLPSATRIPILVSVPHCGITFPEEIKGEYDPSLIETCDDTDWFVDKLYGFAPTLGITMITAEFSRWVIDLNRTPDGTPLYTDGRIITELCPAATFLGQPLYKDQRKKVDAGEVERRKKRYFIPYHQKISQMMAELKREFGTVLLWDCHSIRQVVPTIRKEKFPDLILGSADGASAAESLITEALGSLSRGRYTLQHNDPFKGGYITRTYGIPSGSQHALQLEMSKINYMDDTESRYDPVRAGEIAKLLGDTLARLGDLLVSQKDH